LSQILDATVIDEIAARLLDARGVCVLTGSGISAESGVPTFRDAQTGVWSRYDPQELATPEAFATNPRRVWEWYEWRRQLVSDAVPNAGHQALAHLEARLPGLVLVTQNVDGLHQRAGSRNVLEFHGNLTVNLCSRDLSIVKTEHATSAVPPRCPECGAMLRPGVVWFGEPIPSAVLEQAERAARTCGVFLSVGTSSVVYPAAGLAESALRSGACVIEINPQSTPLTSLADFVLAARAGEVLPRIVNALDERARAREDAGR